MSLPIPANAEFTLTAVADPYGHASAQALLLFRRPLPATDLVWDTAVMWDDRETYPPFKPPMDAGIDAGDLRESPVSQALHAILGHEQATLTPGILTLDEIVEFESHLVTAQYFDDEAGPLNDDSDMGGADILAQRKFWVGIDDGLGNDPTAEPFDPKISRLFERWRDPTVLRRSGAWRSRRAAIARGQALFNSLPIEITAWRA